MIKISAKLTNEGRQNEIGLTTNGESQSISISSKTNGKGSKINGGELLFLALATCYCNDLYREAEKRGIIVDSVSVIVRGEFGLNPGSIAENMEYEATVKANATEEEIEELMKATDRVAEIQNSLRVASTIPLVKIRGISIK